MVTVTNMLRKSDAKFLTLTRRIELRSVLYRRRHPDEETIAFLDAPITLIWSKLHVRCKDSLHSGMMSHD